MGEAQAKEKGDAILLGVRIPMKACKNHPQFLTAALNFLKDLPGFTVPPRNSFPHPWAP